MIKNRASSLRGKCSVCPVIRYFEHEASAAQNCDYAVENAKKTKSRLTLCANLSRFREPFFLRFHNPRRHDE